MRRLILSSALASVVALAAAPVPAQVYKWVDDKGVVNYSSEAPANSQATQLDPKSSRLSIVGTDEAQRQRMLVASAGDSALSRKIDRLEQKLDAERYARSVSDAQAQAAADSWYDQCLRDRRVDCDYAGMDPNYYGYGPYYGAVAVANPYVRRRPGMRPQHPVAKPVGRPMSTARAMAPRPM
jgi:Domain of unknown function (DUF4124)